MKLILASNSPRRKEILLREKYQFEVCPSDYVETIVKEETVYENVMRLSREKALSVAKKYPSDCVIGSDTVVFLDKIYGKPKDESDAYKMLKNFSGKTHEVITGVAIIYPDKTYNFFVSSKVTFKSLSDEQILNYIKTGEPMDKAGAYAIQGIGSKLIESFDGDYDNIVGLPINDMKQYLKF